MKIILILFIRYFRFSCWFYYLIIFFSSDILEFSFIEIFWWTFTTWNRSVSIYASFLHQFNGYTYCLYSTGFWSWLISLIFRLISTILSSVIKLSVNLWTTFSLSSSLLLSPDFYSSLLYLSYLFLTNHFGFLLLLYNWTHFYFWEGGSYPKIYLLIILFFPCF